MTHVRNIGLAALLSFVAAGVGSVIWGALLITNARTSLWVPWSVPVMAGVLVAYWLYLGGRGWPRSTSGKRRELLRARLVPAHIFAWAWAAGGLALVALAGLWIVLVELTGNGGNPTESLLAGYPTVIVVLAIAMGSLVSPLTEEASFRGYAQVLLERHYAPVIAVALSSVLFAVWHGPTQGFFWSKLLFFFAVGVVFGTTAYLTRSVLPAIPVHIVGDLLFFILIWPQDAQRNVIAKHGPDVWFWVAIIQLVVFATLSILVFRRLAASRTAARLDATASAASGGSH